MDGESLRLLSQLPSKPLTTQLKEDVFWRPSYAFNHLTTIFGSENMQNTWPKNIFEYSHYNDNSKYELIFSALSALIAYLKENMLYE